MASKKSTTKKTTEETTPAKTTTPKDTSKTTGDDTKKSTGKGTDKDTNGASASTKDVGANESGKIPFVEFYNPDLVVIANPRKPKAGAFLTSAYLSYAKPTYQGNNVIMRLKNIINVRAPFQANTTTTETKGVKEDKVIESCSLYIPFNDMENDPQQKSLYAFVNSLEDKIRRNRKDHCVEWGCDPEELGKFSTHLNDKKLNKKTGKKDYKAALINIKIPFSKKDRKIYDSVSFFDMIKYKANPKTYEGEKGITIDTINERIRAGTMFKYLTLAFVKAWCTDSQYGYDITVKAIFYEPGQVINYAGGTISDIEDDEPDTGGVDETNISKQMNSVVDITIPGAGASSSAKA